MGIVMNNVDISGDTQYQYYTTYYSYYSKGAGRKEPKPSAAPAATKQAVAKVEKRSDEDIY